VYILRLTHKGPVQNYTALTSKSFLKNVFKLTGGITWSHEHLSHTTIFVMCYYILHGIRTGMFMMAK
jgi:hypothetical protein